MNIIKRDKTIESFDFTKIINAITKAFKEVDGEITPYAKTKATNIAGHIMVQSVLTALFLYFIDYHIGYKGWSINICFPIIVIFANIAMFIITIVSHKHFGKFAISQLVIVLLSLSSTYFIYKGLIKASLLINVSILISIINFGFSLIMCHKDYKEELVRKFNR